MQEAPLGTFGKSSLQGSKVLQVSEVAVHEICLNVYGFCANVGLVRLLKNPFVQGCVPLM
jgi:hypothetical protein